MSEDNQNFNYDASIDSTPFATLPKIRNPMEYTKENYNIGTSGVVHNDVIGNLSSNLIGPSSQVCSSCQNSKYMYYHNHFGYYFCGCCGQ